MPFSAARFCRELTGCDRTGPVTVVQRFESSLKGDVHCHVLFIDGGYHEHAAGSLWIRAYPPPVKKSINTSSRPAIALCHMATDSRVHVSLTCEHLWADGHPEPMLVDHPVPAWPGLATTTAPPRISTLQVTTPGERSRSPTAPKPPGTNASSTCWASEHGYAMSGA